MFASGAAESLRILLAALTEPGQSAHLRAALLGPWFGWPQALVAALDPADSQWNELLEQFERARLRWQRHGPAAALLPWLQEASADLLQADSNEGERFLTDARHLLELLQSEFTRRPGIAELRAWLNRDGTDADQPQSDEHLLRLESDGDRVRVLTLHRAKGLEFDRVWLPLLWDGAGNGKNSSAARPFVVCHQDGERVIDTGGADFLAHQRAADAEAQAEATRLLYVGLTRARFQCTVFYPQRLAPKQPAALTRLLLAIAARHGHPGDAEAAILDLAATPDGPIALEREWPMPYPRLSLAGAAEASALAPAALPRARLPESLWSFSRLHQDGMPQTGVGFGLSRDDEQPVWPPDDGAAKSAADPELARLQNLAGPGFGSALHALLEQALANGASAERIETAEINRSLRQHGIDGAGPEILAAIARLLERCLVSELQPGLRLGDLPATARVAEWTFELPLPGVAKGRLETLLAAHGHRQPLAGGAVLAGALGGSADLVFEWQGRFYLLDYKSNWLGACTADYTEANLDRAMNEAGYPLQYLLYTVALQRYLSRRIGAGYDYDRHFGGVYYLFVRAFGLAPGLGLHYARPEARLIAAIDQLFSGEATEAEA